MDRISVNFDNENATALPYPFHILDNLSEIGKV